MWALCADTPAIVFNFSPDCGARIREALHMQYHDAVKDRRCNDAKHPYFEPKASLERQRQVIILLGEVCCKMKSKELCMRASEAVSIHLNSEIVSSLSVRRSTG